MDIKLPITVLIAAKNEQANIERCIRSLGAAERVVLLDSHSTDKTAELATQGGAEVIQFNYAGGYPKKRQWALDHLEINSPWILLLDADEVVPDKLWQEISQVISSGPKQEGFLIRKGFHFMGRRFRFGGFSHAALLLFKKGKARFEHLVDEPADAQDMEVHERLIVDGDVGSIHTPLIHEDFKGLEAYLDRHNKYSTWEACLRKRFLDTGQWGADTIRPNLFGNAQERRRFLKQLALRVPCEAHLWMLYHYLFKLGILEGQPGLIACRIRSHYIAQVRAKLLELNMQDKLCPKGR